MMREQILRILAEKAANYMEVRVIYDRTNEFGTMPADYSKRLKKIGIKEHVFAPKIPIVPTVYNYRDHRKI